MGKYDEIAERAVENYGIVNGTTTTAFRARILRR